MSGRRVAVLTHFPSPYQLELFDAVERLRPGELVVHYLHSTDPERHWGAQPKGHEARFLGEAGALDHALRDAAHADFLVLNYYDDPRALAVMRARAATGRPWAFWGERPGFVHPLLGRLRRRWMLRELHRSDLPIWGIGGWAVEAYRREFGATRPYVNLPYFSDLSRFASLAGPPASAPRTFLYSGSLTRRKGVDVLARAFTVLAQEFPAARLVLMGRGDLEPSLRTILAPAGDRVEWTGFRSWEELPNVYGGAHVLCAPSRHDGWNLAVPEGLAAGLPVIASDRTGAAIDLVEPGVNGWSVEAGDEESLFDAMRAAAAAAPAQWLDMRENARAAVARHGVSEGAERFLAAVNCGIEGRKA